MTHIPIVYNPQSLCEPRMSVIRFLAFVAIAFLLVDRPDSALAAWQPPLDIRNQVPRSTESRPASQRQSAEDRAGRPAAVQSLLRVNYDGRGARSSPPAAPSRYRKKT